MSIRAPATTSRKPSFSTSREPPRLNRSLSLSYRALPELAPPLLQSLNAEGTLLQESGLGLKSVKMAFNLGGGAPVSQEANGLKDISTDKLAFKALGGDRKLKFLPSPWPGNALPAPTSSLLSVASGKGLVAAAGPDTLIIATTEAVRKAFVSEESVPDNIKAFTPQATLPVPRVSQVAFSSDESSLVICADSGGGLAVYDVQAILQGSKDTAFQLATNGVGVRALVPNPAKDSAHIFAIVLTNGQLLVADLKQRQLVNGPNGPLLREGVSCVSWSAKGKQLVAGLANGTAVQMTPDGTEKAVVPKPPSVANDHHVSTIYWLDNDTWFIWHTPSNNPDPDRPPESILHLARRERNTKNFVFHKISDPCGPFGLNRAPPHHFILRLRDYVPILDDMLIVSSSVSDEINLLTRSSLPLSNGEPADTITNTFTMTTMENDSDRAQLPLPISEATDMDAPMFTSPIGLALDLSSTERVPKPIPAEEMDESTTPLPAFYVLNNEGILCAWWVIHKEAIRKGQVYAGLNVAGGNEASSSTPAPVSQTPATPTPVANMSAAAPSPFGSAFQKPAAPGFGQSGFSSPAAGSAFGGASAMGAKSSPWGSSATPSAPAASGGAFGQPAFGSSGGFGKPAFGSTSAFGAQASSGPGNAFGATGSLGQRQSVWGATTGAKPQETPKANPFSQGGTQTASPFSAMANKPSGFASFASNNTTGGFASLSSSTPTGTSVFASPSQAKSPFGTLTPSNSGTGSSFGMAPSQPSFGSTVSIGSTSIGGSTWASINNTPSQGQSSVFGSKTTAVSSPTREEDMSDDKEEQSKEETPKVAPNHSFGLGSGGFKLSSTFKETAKPEEGEDSGTEKDAGKSFTSGLSSGLFAGSTTTTSTPKATPAQPVTPVKSIEQTPKPSEASTTPASAPKFNETPKAPEPAAAVTPQPKEKIEKKEQAPEQLPGLPGDSEKDELPPLAGSPPIKVEAPDSDLSDEGDVEDDAPLPPDPSTVKKPSWFNQPIPGSAAPAPKPQPKPEAAPLPSGPAKDTHPAWYTPPPPGSGMAGFLNKPAPSLAPSVKPATQDRPRSPPARSPLVMSHTPAGLPKQPIFPPPTAALQTSPRSPSPVRSASTPIGRPLTVPSSKPVTRFEPRPAPKQEEEPDIQDVEADRAQAELAKPIRPTKDVEEFIAYQDYNSVVVSRSGIPGQIERVFRDIQSMIDTLGLNARSLESFVEGHKELLPENGRSEDDLENAGDNPDWALDEVEDLQILQNRIEKSLNGARIENIDGMIAEIGTLTSEIASLRRKVLELKKQIHTLKDPEKVRKTKDAPLNSKQNSQLSLVRGEFAKFQKQLAEAEESLSLLKAKIASAQTTTGGKKATPTVEAVTNTIRKMTSMVEKKSGDIDVLEVQMRKLNMTSSFSSSMNGSRSFTPGRSRESTPFSTPTAGKGRTYGFGYGSELKGSPARNELVLAEEDEHDEVARQLELRDGRKKLLVLLREKMGKRQRKITVVK